MKINIRHFKKKPSIFDQENSTFDQENSTDGSDFYNRYIEETTDNSSATRWREEIEDIDGVDDEEIRLMLLKAKSNLD